MTDVHAHILPNVDDGSDTLEKSVALLKEEYDKGVTAICLTPHLRGKEYCASNEELKKSFENFKKETAAIPLELYLGREVHIYQKLHDDLADGNVLCLGNGKHVLLEFPYYDYVDIDEICYDVILLGYVPVIAHAERYEYFRRIESVQKVRRTGAKIQVNAQSVVRRFGKQAAFTRELIKKRLVDAVASDIHYGRENFIKDAYDKVSKYDESYAEKIFETNPRSFLG